MNNKTVSYEQAKEYLTQLYDWCSNYFDLSEFDQVFVVQTDDELLTFCDDYICYHNYCAESNFHFYSYSCLKRTRKE
jgi:hypothetical protein